MKGKHGASEDTEVPLGRMVEVMKAESNYISTEEIEGGFAIVTEITIKK
jgi:hypothetical protein